MAAPIFSLLYVAFFQQKTEDLYWLLGDLESFFFLVFLYPVVEELTFRGVIQEYIAKKTVCQNLFLHLSVANLLTSLLFVLMHFVHHKPVWALMVFFPSLLFGYFKERFKMVIPSIILHMFYNFTFFSLAGN